MLNLKRPDSCFRIDDNFIQESVQKLNIEVVDNLINQYGCSNLIDFAPRNTKKVSYDYRRGVTAHTNTKYKGVMNMRYWINEVNVITINDINTVNEMKTFVRYPNGTWAAKKEIRCFDDRVMSLIWALIVLEDSVTERYYEIVKYDDNQKPLILKSLDYGVKSFVDPLSIYSNEKLMGDNNNPSPMLFDIGTGNTDQDNDIVELESMGWEIYGRNY